MESFQIATLMSKNLCWNVRYAFKMTLPNDENFIIVSYKII